MTDYHRLPPDPRAWLAGAVLPRRPRSAARVFTRALARHRSDGAVALADLDRVQERGLSGARSFAGVGS